MKILFTSVGRRVELVQAFKEASYCLGIDLKIVGADITETAPALIYCDDEIIVPRISDDRYIPFLMSYCMNEEVDAIIPTIDTDLLLLSQKRAEFEDIGTKVFISNAEKVKICRDKRFTAEYFHSLGLKSPQPVSDIKDYIDSYPAFIKPKDGSSSICAHKVNDYGELEAYSKEVPDYIIQPFVEGTEYTVDVFCDYEGDPIFITPRVRVQVRAGEVLKTKIVNDEKIIEEVKKLVNDFRPRGAITVQLIREKKTGDDYYIEINPRFGGGAPLSIRAGANSAEAVLRILQKDRLEYKYAAAHEGAVYSRFDNCVVVDGNEQQVKCVIFDLDDTLYNEEEYVKSGYKAIAQYIGDDSAFDRLIAAFKSGKPALDEVFGDDKRKTEYLAVYRRHIPSIELAESTKILLSSLREKGVRIGVLTDGRPEGQRNKIKALELEKYVDEILVTDELGGSQFRKPCDIGFRVLQRRFNIPYENILYVGDNVSKDFNAPRQLGMQVGVLKNRDGLYKSQDTYCSKRFQQADSLNALLDKFTM